MAERSGRDLSRGFWSDTLSRLRRDPTTMAAIVVLGMLVGLALAADVLAQHLFRTSFSALDLPRSFDKPSLEEPRMWFGLDALGRSEVVRMLYGGRVSLFVGTFGSLVALTIGLAVGMTAGYFGGWWDDVAVWAITTIESIPLIYFLIMIGLYFRLDALSLTVFIGAIAWLSAANLARGQTISLREREYVTAARTIGASPWGIILRHIFPNVLPLMIVVLMLAVGGTILAESAISFLGFGIQPPQPSWGNMLSGATQYYFKGPHLILFPGAAITLTVLCVFLIGDGLRDALDPRLRGSESIARR
ncbi:MAG: ABC transporter permease [Chloroflexi bacterium]|nr:ABC transporter permease [Chloroflexota bacterium]